jgi:hypothetical protein
MSSINTGGPAFPTLDYIQPSKLATNQDGMTLRDYFAAKAMSGMMSDPSRDMHPVALGKYSYELADAMLEVRAQ